MAQQEDAAAKLGNAEQPSRPVFGTIVLDEAFSKSSQAVAARIIQALSEFGLHTLFVTPTKKCACCATTPAAPWWCTGAARRPRWHCCGGRRLMPFAEARTRGGSAGTAPACTEQGAAGAGVLARRGRAQRCACLGG